MDTDQKYLLNGGFTFIIFLLGYKLTLSSEPVFPPNLGIHRLSVWRRYSLWGRQPIIRAADWYLGQMSSPVRLATWDTESWHPVNRYLRMNADRKCKKAYTVRIARSSLDDSVDCLPTCNRWLLKHHHHSVLFKLQIDLQTEIITLPVALCWGFAYRFH